MKEGVCPKCGWKAPAGLLKCPFCKTYIRKPGEGSSAESARLKKADSDEGVVIKPLDPDLPPPDPNIVKRVQRHMARELFDDSDKWDVFEKDPPSDAVNPDEKTDVGGKE